MRRAGNPPPDPADRDEAGVARAVDEIVEHQRRIVAGVVALARRPKPRVGITPRTAVYREDKLILYRYRARRPRRGVPPLLIVYALVNRPYLLDLQPDRSVIRGLLNAGIDVFLIDWGYPDGGDRFLELADYVPGYIDRSIDVICRRTGYDRVNVLGVCQGGTLSLCYAALRPERIARLALMVTPVDFHTSGDLLSVWIRRIDVDRLVDVAGNVPGELLNQAFQSLLPFRLRAQKPLDLADIGKDPAQLEHFLRMEQWIFDSPDQPGEMFRQFAKLFYQQNRLMRGRFRIGRLLIDTARITMPVLNVYALRDHIVPPDASLALEKIIRSRDYRALAFDAGHIGIFVGAQATVLPAIVAGWLQEEAG